jgi:hypothetical protein
VLRASVDLPDAVARYFELDAERDVEGVTALFVDDATVVDEGETYTGPDAIRSWRAGPASRHMYTTVVSSTDAAGTDRFVVIGRLTGNLPGGTAHLRWDFTVADDRIARLVIAP